MLFVISNCICLKFPINIILLLLPSLSTSHYHHGQDPIFCIGTCQTHVIANLLTTMFQFEISWMLRFSNQDGNGWLITELYVSMCFYMKIHGCSSFHNNASNTCAGNMKLQFCSSFNLVLIVHYLSDVGNQCQHWLHLGTTTANNRKYGVHKLQRFRHTTCICGQRMW